MNENLTKNTDNNSLMPQTADLANASRGFLMGAADIVPGVSGGTMALILGIYERLVQAISHVDRTFLGHIKKRQWRNAAEHVDLRFLITLGCGIAIGIGGLATLMNWLLEFHLEPTLAAFFGLILASSVIVARTIDRWTIPSLLFVLAGAGFAYWLVARPFLSGADGNLYLFFCGMVAICAMILPGISGAFILLILGKYYYVTGIIKSFVHGEITVEHITAIIIFASGCVIGLLAFSKFLRWLLARFHAQTMATLCGFMLGSLRRIWPFKEIPSELADGVDLKHNQLSNIWPESLDGSFWLAVGLAITAFLLVILIDYAGRRLAKEETSVE